VKPHLVALPLAALPCLVVTCGGNVSVTSTATGGAGAATSASASTGSAHGGASPGTGGSGATGPTSSTGAGAGGSATATTTTTTTGTGGAAASSSAATSSSSTTSSSTTSSGADGGMICPGFGDACSDCVSTACPAVFCACADDAACLALSACFGNCTTEACRQTCQSAHPSAIAELYALGNCAGTSCASQCPGNMPLTPCVKCAVDTCPGALDTCLGDPVCVALYQCFDACAKNDLVCQQECFAEDGAGTVELQALVQCETTPCASSCM
jgi:hypothetical protein